MRRDGNPRRGGRHGGRRRRGATAAGAGVAALLAGAALMLAAPTGHADPLAGTLGPCVPGSCPDPFPPVNSGPFAGRDDAVSVYVGKDFAVTGAAAEAEGRVVVMGSLSVDQDAEDSAGYSVGIAAVGSRVPPPDGADFLTVGGDITVAPGQQLTADGGVVRHAGTASGAITGTLTADPDATTQYTPLSTDLTAASQCYEIAPKVTGTAANEGYQTVFTGDGTSALQVFDLDFDLTGTGGGAQTLVFDQIPATATVIVNMLGTHRAIVANNGSVSDSDPFNSLRTRLLWNFPDAKTVTIGGSDQFQGSVLIGDPRSTTTVTAAGMNGRFYTTGALTQTSSAGNGGQAFHNYPFDGDLPTCVVPTPPPTVAATTTDAPSATAG